MSRTTDLINDYDDNEDISILAIDIVAKAMYVGP